MALIVWIYGLQKYIKPDHFDAIARLLIIVATTWFFFFFLEWVWALYTLESPEIALRELQALEWPYGPLFAIFVITSFVIPVPLWLFKRVRRSPMMMFITTVLVNVGMWLERFLIIIPGLVRRGHMTFDWGTYHPSLIEIGLIRYRNILEKKGETRLFPKLNYYKGKGGWSGSFSHWWNVTYLPKIGLKNLKDRKTDSHTFRHTCLNKMKLNGVEESLAMEYAGHHHSSMTFTTYSDRYDPSILRDRVLDKINYKGLDIDGLRVNWSQIFKNPTKDQLR